MERSEFLAALRRGTELVAVWPAAKPGWRAWVAVWSAVHLEDHPGIRNPDLKLIWLAREWDPEYVEKDLCWAEDDGMHTLQHLTSVGEEQLWDTLERLCGYDAFDYPWNTDYPG
ncbi:hypothetical protein G5C51_13610 [Streptomyces sp. A7024]|uniref:Uncharacterized protein n=1 Tax=Streptomyces coryli TaxID=1128680 RepID=A0A6G4TZI7_9ACTN|nr:hypothetical protein [Streptomyces coryli]NGN64930.1 hypothetical protein [Streptomyces coryli]